MLIGLHVRNLALIEEEEMTFTPGLNILTGETGAGKSMILGSCLAALGAKADRSMIREGAEYALIEMTLLAATAQQKQVLSSLGLEPEEDGTVIIKRRIYPGRTVCQICGETVTLKECAAVGQAFIDVYGQRDHFTLLHRENQLKALDEFAGARAEELLSGMKAAWNRVTALQKELDAVSMDQAARNRELDILSYEIGEIESAGPVPGEDEKLKQSFRRRSSMDRIHRSLLMVQACTGDDDDGAAGQIGRAVHEMAQVAGLDASLDPLSDMLGDLESLLHDINRELADRIEEAVPDEEALAEITARLDLINHIKDKYGPSLEDVAHTLTELQARDEELRHADEKKAALEKELAEARSAAAGTAAKLTALRQEAAEAFSARMEASLKNLNFETVTFDIRMDTDAEQMGVSGCDRVHFHVSLNPGEQPHPLEQTASGGELSRIMLAMKTVIAGTDEGHTFIFDEIDSGISGQTAWKVAEELGRLSAGHQILCITHLPQIASMADSHFEIRKDSDGARTFTHVRRLDETQSELELARLLGSDSAEGAALLNAREIRQKAAEVKSAAKKAR